MVKEPGLQFQQALNDWEIEDAQLFMRMLSNGRVNQMGKDRLIWRGDKSGNYRVKAGFNILEGNTDITVPHSALLNLFF